MKEISLIEFKNIIDLGVWARDQTIEIVGRHYIQWDCGGCCGEKCDGHVGDTYYEYGVSRKISRLAEIEIRYVEQFDYMKGDIESLSTYVYFVDQAFTFNINVVNENGSKLEGPILWSLLSPHFNSIDYSGLCLV